MNFIQSYLASSMSMLNESFSALQEGMHFHDYIDNAKRKLMSAFTDMNAD